MRPLALTAFAALAALALLLPVAPAHAVGVVWLSWNACTGPVNVPATSGSVLDAYVSVLGQSQTALSYQCVVTGRASAAVPDAWRFDPTGCEGSAQFALNHQPPAAVAKTCPSFQGDLASLQIKDFAYDATTGRVKITLANAFPNNDQGNPAATNPAQRYFLANDHFDLALATTGPSNPGAGTCGGLETPVCFELVSASWLDVSYVEHDWPRGNTLITANDPNNVSQCFSVVPAHATTWGAVKGQYR